MTRQEFSQIIADYRKSSGITVKEICCKLNCLPGDIYRIEKASHNYNLQKCIQYLNVLGLVLKLRTFTGRTLRANNYDTLVRLLVQQRNGIYTQQELAKKIGWSPTVLGRYERHEITITIDAFLKIVDALGLVVVLPVKTISKVLPRRQNMTKQKFSKLISNIRKKEKCTLNQISRRAGMTFIQIQRIEMGCDIYPLIDAIKYINAVGRAMQLTQGNRRVVVHGYEDIPEFLRETRELKGLTQEQLVQVAGLSTASISEIETQRVAMHIDSFLAIASALKIKIELKYR